MKNTVLSEHCAISQHFSQNFRDFFKKKTKKISIIYVQYR